jgi:HEPN domain-containing protein
MRVTEAVLKVVREWIVKADHDLTAAIHILKVGTAAPAEIVSFHAQQCVEKYLKAILVYRSIPFPKSHDIRALMALVPRRLRPALGEGLQDRLTQYAGPARAPRGSAEVTQGGVAKKEEIIAKQGDLQDAKGACRQRP